MEEDLKGCEVGRLEPVDDNEFQGLSELLGTLSNKTSLAILHIAIKQGDVCTCRLQQSLGLPQPTITVHLHKLYSAGFLSKRKAWRYTYYSVKKEHIAFLSAVLGEKRTINVART